MGTIIYILKLQLICIRKVILSVIDKKVVCFGLWWIQAQQHHQWSIKKPHIK